MTNKRYCAVKKNVDKSVSNEFLEFLARKRDIDLEELQNEYEMEKQKELLEKHEAKIWQGKDGKWRTYIKGTDGKRKMIKLKSKEELEKRVVDYQKRQSASRTIGQVYDEWISYKVEVDKLSQSSRDRYDVDFQRFFVGSSLSKIPISDITEDDLTTFIKEAINKNQLSNKSYSGLKTVLKGIFLWAKQEKFVTLSINDFLRDLILPKQMFKSVIKNREEEIFEEEDLPRILKYVMDNKNIWNLACLLAFQTGLRAGELSTLKRTDINFQEKELSVTRTETYYKDTTGKKTVHVKEHTKTDAGNRNVILTNSAMNTIREIIDLNPDGEYLFEGRKGNRIRGNTISKRLSRICIELGIVHKTLHKARKTYGTALIDGAVDDSTVAEQMGHTDVEETKQYYYFSNKSRRKKHEQIEAALAI